MTLNRKTHKAYNRTRENNFSIDGLAGMDLHGKTAGIIGTGKICLILIGREAMEKMKDGVMIVNTGRGGLIDSAALIEDLKRRKIGSAGLDV